MATIERLGVWRYAAATAAIAFGAFLVGRAAPQGSSSTALTASAPASLDDTRVIPAAYQPAAYQPGYQPAVLMSPAAAQPIVAQPAPSRVVYQRAPSRVLHERVRQTRSVKKSAIIIGSSAGVGAGIGAAIGGRKGAGIGALLGGGSAALWDQLTRRK